MHRVGAPVHFLLAWALLVLSGGAVLCQEDGDVPTIHVSTDLVQLPVLVFKPPMRPAAGLSAQDFTIRLDDGPPFHPTFLRDEGNEPIDLAVVVLPDAADAAQMSTTLGGMLAHLPPGLLQSTDRLSFYVAGCRLIRSLLEAPADFASQADAIAKAASATIFASALEQGAACRYPSIDAVLRTVAQQFADRRGWPVVLVISKDGSELHFESVAKTEVALATQAVTLFSIVYTGGYATPVRRTHSAELSELVTSLGGVSSATSLQTLDREVYADLQAIRSRYILSFPRPGNGTGGVHRLDVGAKRSGVTVRASAVSTPVVDLSRCNSPDGLYVCVQGRPSMGSPRPPYMPAPR